MGTTSTSAQLSAPGKIACWRTSLEIRLESELALSTQIRCCAVSTSPVAFKSCYTHDKVLSSTTSVLFTGYHKIKVLADGAEKGEPALRRRHTGGPPSRCWRSPSGNEPPCYQPNGRARAAAVAGKS